MARRKRKTKRRQYIEFVFYVVEIESWDWSYSFGLTQTRHDDEPYMEYRHLTMKGKLLRPRKVKADAVEVTLLPDARLKEENRKQDEPRAVGSLSLGRGTLQALLSLPMDALDSILQMLTADKFRYVVINSDTMRYRQAAVKHYRIEANYDPEDLPPDE